MSIGKYYGPRGRYLEEHKNYFSKKQLKKDVDFLVDTLKLKKKDKILDLACGQGRHLIELKKRGYDVEGLDFSAYLLRIAKKQAQKEGLKINFSRRDVHNFRLNRKYDKIFLFFSEFGLFDSDKVLRNVSRHLKRGGLFLLDCDNLFRLIDYLKKHPRSKYVFDFARMELREKSKKGPRVRYYTFPELEKLFIEEGFKIRAVYGGYQKEELNAKSKRMIVVAKKG